MVHAQAALAKQEKISDVMIGHFQLQPQRLVTIAVVHDDYPKLFSLLILAHGLKRYPENFVQIFHFFQLKHGLKRYPENFVQAFHFFLLKHSSQC